MASLICRVYDRKDGVSYLEKFVGIGLPRLGLLTIAVGFDFPESG